MSNNDDWDFKIDRGVAPEAEKKPAKKRSLEDIAEAFSPEAPQDLALDHEALPPRSARLENFKKTVALERFAEIKAAPLGRRIQAGLVDLAFVAAAAGGAWLSFPMWREKLEKALPPSLLGNVPYPEQVLEYSIPVLAIFLVHVFPSCWWRKSLGKKIFNLRIGWKEDDCGVPKKAVLWREVVAKPISCLSVIGLLFVFLGKRKRALHDFLSGTVVYDEL